MLRERAKGRGPALALLLGVLLLAVTATAGVVLAARPTDTSEEGSSGGGQAPAAPRTIDAYAHFAPAGPLTVLVGSRFTLDLMVNSGSNAVTVAQSYVTFTQSLLQNVDPSMPGCVLADTITQDTTAFSTLLQNEVCNDSEPCDLG